MPARIDDIALSLLPIGRWRTVAEQLRNGVRPTDILDAHCADGLRGRTRPPLWADAARLRAKAQHALRRAESAGLQPLFQNESQYPAPLMEIVDPPPVLWVAGRVAALSGDAVAIVGSRAGSSYALSVAERLASDLCAQGLTVVSGLARGVDSAAHRGAIAVGGVTVGVLGCGADVVYPPENGPLVAEVVRMGAVVSELVPGTVPKAAFFPRRNRIISGLVRAVVVVEAGEKSGSLITARCALEQGRDVLAVPGSVLSGRNRGGHALLRDGARLVETAEDILDELGIARGARVDRGRSAEVAEVNPILAALTPGEATDLEQISSRTGLSAVVLLPRLLELELRGALKREPGGRFVRFGQSC